MPPALGRGRFPRAVDGSGQAPRHQRREDEQPEAELDDPGDLFHDSVTGVRVGDRAGRCATRRAK